MLAVVFRKYGSPDVLELQDVPKPVPSDEEILVKVVAASVNPVDWHGFTGTPYLARMNRGWRNPKGVARLGVDFAGTVEAVGKDVTNFRSGDEVFGGRDGALAEYVCVRAHRAVVPKPANVSFEQAASVAVAATTALQAVRDKGGIRPGYKVLINGASGGVGTFAVQIAKALGAEEVTAVCSTRHVDLVQSIGADHVIDYTREDFAPRGVDGQRYDLAIHNAGSRPWSAYQRVLTPKAPLVITGAAKKNRLIGPFGYALRTLLRARLTGRKVVIFLADIDKQAMETLAGLLQTGQVVPVIERRYKFSEVADAFRYLGEGHAQGKIIVTM
jgi:NADPH:quinone reductase-like Zn-dependent oxidoreductase